MKLYCLLALLMPWFHCFGQSTFKHPSLISVSFNENDFKNKIPLKSIDDLDAGLSVHFTKGINQRFDWQITYTASFPDSFSSDQKPVNEKNFLSELDFVMRLRMFPKMVALQPYWLTGLGCAFVNNQVSSCIVLGPGLQWHFKDVYVHLNALYKPNIAGNVNNHYAYSIGVGGSINKPKVKKNKNAAMPVTTNPVVIIHDTDGDGIVDSVDTCPTIAGVLQFNGCPDSDRDGIPDRLDNCPTVFGKEKYKGCPPPDTDGDGINDEEDSCVNVPGIIQKHGCPELNENTIKNLNSAANRIYFEIGKAILLKESFAALDTVATILKEYTSQHLIIEGHTDNVGNDETNLALSEHRAKAVFIYLVQKGIAAGRLSYKGFGETKPVADNNIPEGRARNRRVELKIY